MSTPPGRPALDTVAERQWLTEALADRSGAVHDRIQSYLHTIDALRARVAEVEASPVNVLLRDAGEAMLAWPYSSDPAKGSEEATTQMRRALQAAGAGVGACYTEAEVKSAVECVCGRLDASNVIETLQENRTKP